MDLIVQGRNLHSLSYKTNVYVHCKEEKKLEITEVTFNCFKTIK